MKFSYLKKISLLAFLTLAIWSCKDKKKSKLEILAEAKKELIALQNQQKNLADKIDSTTALIASLDTTKIVGAPIYVEPINTKTFTKYISINGSVDAVNSVIASPQTPGVVRQLLVSVGQHVSKGQTVAILDDNVVNQGIKEIDQQISFAYDVYKRQKSLWDQNIGSEIQMLTAKNNYESLLNKKNTTKAQKALYNIVSPISGVIDAVDIKVGEMASPGSPRGIRIVSDNNLKVTANIGEGYVSNISAGDQVMVVFPDLRDSVVSRIQYVSNTIDPISRTFKADIAIPKKPKYRPNMLVELKVAAYSKANDIVLPSAFIQHDPEGDFVMVIRNGKVTKAYISSGESYNGDIEILSGIYIDDKIITMGFQGLQEGDAFSIISTQ